jgi:hypothetical protein
MTMDRNLEPKWAVLVTGGELSGCVQKVNVPKPVALAAMRELVRDGLQAIIVPVQWREGVVRIVESTH